MRALLVWHAILEYSSGKPYLYICPPLKCAPNCNIVVQAVDDAV